MRRVPPGLQTAMCREQEASSKDAEGGVRLFCLEVRKGFTDTFKAQISMLDRAWDHLLQPADFRAAESELATP